MGLSEEPLSFNECIFEINDILEINSFELL